LEAAVHPSTRLVIWFLVLVAIQGLDGLSRFGTARHLDEAEAFRATGISVHDHLGRLNRTMRCKHVFEIDVGNTIRQIPNIQLRGHAGPPSGVFTQH